MNGLGKVLSSEGRMSWKVNVPDCSARYIIDAQAGSSREAQRESNPVISAAAEEVDYVMREKASSRFRRY